jgi:hypothetical protein
MLVKEAMSWVPRRPGYRTAMHLTSLEKDLAKGT